MRRLISLLVLIYSISYSVFAQGMVNAQIPQGENLKVPEGWEIRLDKPMENLVVSANPDSGDIYFVNMTPGWHLTTGPRAIFWHPNNHAKDNYTLQSSIYTFDPKGRDREGFGLFFGGQNLKNDQQSYIYFLIRNTGDFLIKSRLGMETKEITPWTASDAIVRFTDKSDSSELNTLSVKIRDTTMTFFINNTEVFNLVQATIQTDGQFGLRVNHAVNIHVSDLSVMSN